MPLNTLFNIVVFVDIDVCVVCITDVQMDQ